MLPTVDIFDEGDRLQVIAELPGIDESDITHSVEGTHLILNAVRGERKIFKKIDLGSAVKGEPTTHYKNGILEMQFTKA